MFVSPIVLSKRQAQLAEDLALATKLNEAEAEAAEALFECECCFASVPFESIATCSDDCHQLCFNCVHRTVSEALFGQGWSRTIDLERSTVRCFAPTSRDCHGVIPSDLLRCCLVVTVGKEDLWTDFQDRVTGM